MKLPKIRKGAEVRLVPRRQHPKSDVFHQTLLDPARGKYPHAIAIDQNLRHHPRMMTKILVYGYCVGVFSSRRIQKRLVEDVAFRVLAAGNQPDFRTLSDFRKLHLRALEELFRQVLRITLETGTMKLGRVALDGSKVKANASKHRAMSYGRMRE